MSQDTTSLIDARPTRRSVTRAAAWSVPVIAVATTAPAYAASCPKERADIGDVRNFRRESATWWWADFDVDGSGPKPTNRMNVRSSYDTGMVVRNDGNGGANDNFTIDPAVGALGTYGLVMAQRPSDKTPRGENSKGHYVFTFDRDVYNLTFTLTDIDSAVNDFIDNVVLTAGFTSSDRASALTGTGRARTSTRASDPFRPTGTNNPVDNNNSAAGNVTITYPGPIRTFTIDYWNSQSSYAERIDQDQVITISNFSFDYMPC